MNLTEFKGLSSKRLEALQSVHVKSINELLHLFPYRYLDRTNIKRIKDLVGNGEEVTVSGKINSIDEQGYGRKKRLEITINDGTGTLKAIWFRGIKYFKNIFKEGELVCFYGIVKRYGSDLTIAHPELDKIDEKGDLNTFSRIVPIYPGTKELSKARVTSKLIQSWVSIALNSVSIDEFLPSEFLDTYGFPSRMNAFHMIHFPTDHSERHKALERFKFEEFFLFQLAMEHIHNQRSTRNRGIVMDRTGNNTSEYFNKLIPFELTEGQQTALSDIKLDLRSGVQMNRLIQGDVGAGKTIVALGSILMAIDNGFQTAFVAPTEILAEQHFKTLTEHLKPLGINIRLLVGGQKAALRRDILNDISGGTCQVVVGTHAILQEEVHFYNLGLAVIDEQHRFGVKQRAHLLNKGEHPHMLVMSATPIPRSLAMTAYADLDISVIKGLPKGRKPIKTAIRTDSKRENVYSFLRTELAEGGQAYVVFPLIEESEALDLKDATAGYEKLKSHFPNATIALLHGKLKSEEKDEIMAAFKANEIQILVSTTVIEVGVDVPNASIMIIEHAERFGLSQLHQLRGRIGRGSRQGYCILMPGLKISEAGRFRLKTMTDTNDGFKIAEADLKLRGPGDFLGTKQSGLPDFKHADIIEDQLLLAHAKQAAKEVLASDPELTEKKHANLKAQFTPYFNQKKEFYGLG